jgi:BolA protein
MTAIEMMRKQLAPLDPVKLDITDQSDLHAGHAGAKGGGHYQMTIVSPRFADKRTIERHRMVYDALGSLMRREIHALSICAKTPDEP